MEYPNDYKLILENVKALNMYIENKNKKPEIQIHELSKVKSDPNKNYNKPEKVEKNPNQNWHSPSSNPLKDKVYINNKQNNYQQNTNLGNNFEITNKFNTNSNEQNEKGFSRENVIKVYQEQNKAKDENLEGTQVLVQFSPAPTQNIVNFDEPNEEIKRKDQNLPNKEDSKETNNLYKNVEKAMQKGKKKDKKKEEKIIKGNCYICANQNTLVIFLNCCDNCKNICIECFKRQCNQMNKCPFCNTTIENPIKDKIIAEVLKDSNEGSKPKEMIFVEICQVCRFKKKCLTINCCWANDKQICGRCASVLRPYLLEDFSCPQCKYVFDNIPLVNSFQQEANKEKPLFQSIFQNNDFHCKLCNSPNNRVEGQACCDQIFQICSVCLSKALSFDSCPFCKCKYNDSLKLFAVNKYIESSTMAYTDSNRFIQQK